MLRTGCPHPLSFVFNMHPYIELFVHLRDNIQGGNLKTKYYYLYTFFCNCVKIPGRRIKLQTYMQLFCLGCLPQLHTSSCTNSSITLVHQCVICKAPISHHKQDVPMCVRQLQCPIFTLITTWLHSPWSPTAGLQYALPWMSSNYNAHQHDAYSRES